MLMFPPFTSSINGTTFNGGYAFLFTKPGGTYSDMFHIDVSLLFVQLLFVGAIGFVGWLLLKSDGK